MESNIFYFDTSWEVLQNFIGTLPFRVVFVGSLCNGKLKSLDYKGRLIINTFHSSRLYKYLIIWPISFLMYALLESN